MKKEQLKESGLLELYVLGKANEQEVKLIQQFSSESEIQQELVEIEKALINEAKRSGNFPQASLKEKLDNTLGFSAQESSTINITKVVPLKNNYQLLAVAASFALLLSIGLNLLQYSSNSKTEKQLASIYSINDILKSEVGITKDDNKFLSSVVSFFEKGKIEGIPIKCTETGHEWGMVYHDSKTGKTSVVPADLPKIKADQSYQLWAVVNGKPVDLGIIPNENVGTEHFTMLKEAINPEAFCITIESFGGASDPSMEMLVAQGNP